MKNQITFSNVIGVLLENRKKTYTQYQMVQSIFSEYLDDTLKNVDLYPEDHTQISKWCSGERAIPKDIVRVYDEENLWDAMQESFTEKIIPNLLNEAQARSQLEALLLASVDVIGTDTANAIIELADNAAFFTAMIRYAILNDHKQNVVYSPDLTEHLLSGRTPSCTKEFLGRKKELSEAGQSSAICYRYCWHWKK